MHKEGEEIHVDDTEASAGEKSGHMRWVLAVGLLLAIGLLSLIWIAGALSQGEVEERATVSGTLEAIDDRGQESDVLIPEVDEGPIEVDGAEASAE